ncbi:polyphosphate kinase 2 family protein [Lactiplantibacillus mudanjiangensis]|uniref:Phosphate--nucleotide phosphotransferase [Lactobacillus sp.] n=1 Tax=Lactiplantibacillus mudanjiangensis TaxID=1296538 RepID=A0A660DVV4_9LACO|nr:polyphosphate kinase 2 family protein [Lactiplantibacillus mudanjiangensis]VDG18966.1 phosphate--nucleotide phosphotransferase [Lactobacillus sp.] [Lactiplantibacillus mudanjiangensis]VDG25258.1 phosphate--nucleotide phosphotransferase [Lactobacillus sp.] [Lactiplantibacillus mudanjiangensis]VDG27488.1 phosphate--nucleotide phosphotransferase [Lactobacillus sp.] [Lactiplantibacillus mudanjiangensis]VDG33065.1 phosphate--nucleotide phosphotransferase [Lactobacillus sp.] [Lactiplantibacillus m
MNFEKQYRYTGKQTLNLTEQATAPAAEYTDEKVIKNQIAKNIKQLTELQGKLYAQDRHGVLIIFQAMDAAGKDSMIAHIMSGINPQGCVVTSFKQPTSNEVAHDYLWRIHNQVPKRGMIGIFNRSYYEDVLVSRVHPNIIVNEHIGDIESPEQVNDDFFNRRFKDLRYFEDYLQHNGYTVLKFFLHMSKAEQKQRFIRRIEIPSHNWKFSAADIRERQYWDDYQRVYDEAITNTATKSVPWYVIPSDSKWYSRLCVSEIINQRLGQLPLAYPSLDADNQAQLKTALEQLDREND